MRSSPACCSSSPRPATPPPGSTSRRSTRSARGSSRSARAAASASGSAFDVAVFDIELRDEIRNVNVVPFPGAPFTIPAYENIDRSRHWGVELALDLQLARDLAAPFGAEGGGELRAQTSYTYSRFEFVRDDAVRQQRPARCAAPLHDRGAALAARLGPLARAAGRVGGGALVRRQREPELRGRVLALERARGLRPRAERRRRCSSRGATCSDRDYVSSVVVDAGDQRYFEPGDGRGVFGGVEWRWH